MKAAGIARLFIIFLAVSVLWNGGCSNETTQAVEEKAAAQETAQATTQSAPETTDKIQVADAGRAAGNSQPAANRDAPSGRRSSEGNRLSGQQSLYLQRHASNPVNWFPWGDEAFEKARAEDKLIFLSVGYSSCHWCRVMEEESFSREDVAEIMNANYISIKVDREERPDVDGVYMSALQRLNGGSGGWPMSLWLTPDLKPFYAKTYMPRDEFKTALTRLAKIYNDPNQRGEIEEQAAQVAMAVKSDPAKNLPPAKDLDRKAIELALQELKANYDAENGGFAKKPKFPSAPQIEMLFRKNYYDGDKQALDMAVQTLRKMADGALFDQLGGGFHRYTTDEKWRVPHFEKMLYDNALLAKQYIDAFVITRDPFFLDVAEKTLAFLANEMQDAAGGFFSAQNADSGGKEGAFYIWTPAQMKAALGGDAALAMEWYGVTKAGNFENGASTLYVADREGFLKKNSLRPSEWKHKLDGINQKLLAARAKRTEPEKDKKIVADWNAMAISAFARAYQITNNQHYLDIALKAADRIEKDLYSPATGKLKHTQSMKDGWGFLPDYAFFTGACIDLYESAFDLRRLMLALDLAHKAVNLLYEPGKMGFLFAPENDKEMLKGYSELFESGIPAGNGELIQNLYRLAALFDDQSLRETARNELLSIQPAMLKAHRGFDSVLNALDLYMSPSQEIAIAGTEGAPDTMEMLALVRSFYLPNSVLAVYDPDAPNSVEIEDAVPLLMLRHKRDGMATAYVCENYACRRPVTTLQDLSNALLGIY